MNELNFISFDNKYYFSIEDDNARNELGSINNSYLDNVNNFKSGMENNFQNSLNGISNTLAGYGAASAGNNVEDIVNGIGEVYDKQYNNGYNSFSCDAFINGMNNLNESTVATAYLINDSVTNMSKMFAGNQSYMIPTCGINVTDMSYAYSDSYNWQGCTNLVGSPVCGPNVTNMSDAYEGCSNLTGSPVCGPNVTDMIYAYSGCNNLTGSPVCGPNVTDMNYAYSGCSNLTITKDDFYFDKKYNHSIQMYGIYNNSGTTTFNLIDIYDEEVIDKYGFAGRFSGAKIIGNPICSSNVTDMCAAYLYCINLTGNPVCGDNVTNMSFAYFYCINLTGNPVCGDNVTNMSSAYFYCINLTGNPVCGDNVTNMKYAYNGCINLTGNPVCGDNVTDMSSAYYRCINLYGDMRMNYNQSPDRTKVNASRCFSGRNNQNRLNIHVPKGYAWDNWLYNVGELTGVKALAWTDMENGYYNTAENIYVYNNVIL